MTEIPTAEEFRLAAIVLRTFREFPALRLFPQITVQCLGEVIEYYEAHGLCVHAVLACYENDAGPIALAGSVFGYIQGNNVGADAAAIQAGIERSR